MAVITYTLHTTARKTVARRVASLPKSATTSTKSPARLHLPRRLPKPIISPIDSRRLSDVVPELSGAPLSYVTKSLLSKPFQSSMLHGLSSTIPKASLVVANDCLPSQLPVQFESPATPIIRPDFFAAVHDNQINGQAFLYPCHSLPFIAHCAALPSLLKPTSKECLPVVSIQLPHPESFHIIRDFIYTHSQSALLASLLPIAPSLLSSEASDVPGLSKTIAASLTPAAVYEMVKRIRGFWANVCALGVADEALWKGLQMSWEVTMSAMALISERASR